MHKQEPLTIVNERHYPGKEAEFLFLFCTHLQTATKLFEIRFLYLAFLRPPRFSRIIIRVNGHLLLICLA